MTGLFEHPNPGGLRPLGRIEAIKGAIDPVKVDDQRFGQFILNVLRTNGLDEADMWHVEDAAWTKMLSCYPEPVGW